ncbi:CTL/SLC44 family protein [Candidatus Bathyarchaeota archaeon]|nr:CTL/SLC44 family protein [Candidatus Bathyarchaeota archaeon]
MSGIAIRGYATTRGISGIYDGTDTFGFSTNTLILFAFCLAMALVLSWGYVWLARLFPKQLFWATVVLNVVSAFVMGIYMIAMGSLAGIMFLVFGVFLMFMYWTWRKRVPFSVLMLKTSIDVAKTYGHVYLVSFLGGLVTGALGAWFAVAIVAIYVRWSPGGRICTEMGDCSEGKAIGLLVYATFTMFWLSEWLKNTIHTTISGVYGSWYYNSRNYPSGVTRGALRRSVTYSFGSISLGSLFVAIINFIRQLCSVAYESQAGEGGFVGMCFYCFLQLVLGFIQWAVEFVNQYAFSYIALFGKAYFPAAKDTWRMIKDRGVDTLINVSQPPQALSSGLSPKSPTHPLTSPQECIVGQVLTFGALFVAYTCSLLAYLYLFFTKPGYNTGGQWTSEIMFFSFVIGWKIADVFTTPISSGVDTIFVASAWDPEVLMRDHPELYGAMIRVYPQVQVAIHA